MRSSLPTSQQFASLARVRSGGTWLVLIAAVSALNSLGAAMNSIRIFVLGLGISRAIDSIGQMAVGEMTDVVKIASLAASLLVAALFLAIGLLARKQNRKAFIWGLLLYSFDGFILVSARDMLAVAFHTVALYVVFRGYQACCELQVTPATAPETESDAGEAAA